MKLLIPLVCVALNVCHVQQTVAQSARRPNIIFILADDMGIGDVGCFGQKIIKTPNIDQLANDGVKMTNFYAGSAVCSPSRCALMTGKHTGHTAIRSNKNHPDFGPFPMPPNTPTVAGMLRKAGYRTALCGRWHLGETYSESTPDKMGFDYTFGQLGRFFKPSEFRFRADMVENGKEVIVSENLNGKRGKFIEDLTTEKGLEFVKNNQQKPFFLFMSYSLVHDPLDIDDLGEYKNADFPETEKAFAASVTRFDSYVEQFRALLKSLRLEENTLLIVTSDNGPHAEGGHNPDYFDSNGAFRGIKRDLYEGGLRMPFVASWKGWIKPGTSSDHPAAFWDFMPTVAELAKTTPDATDGISFVPALLGQPQRPHPYLYWEITENRPKQAVRMGKWKGLYWNDSREMELYDLEKDPAEAENVAKKFPEKVREIQEIMRLAHVPHPDFPLLETESYVQVSPRNPKYLMLGNGGTFVPNGVNICFPRFISDEAAVFNYYETYFKKLSENGGNYTRIWLSIPLFEVEQIKAGSYDFVLAQRVEKVVALAEKYRIKVKFCLEHFRQLTGYPAKFAGSVAFDRPVYSEKLPSVEDFFTTKTGKALFLNRVEFWANRFAKNPTVLGWELWNEVNAVQIADKNILFDWTAEMLPEVQKRFPRQLVMQSLGSFDSEAGNELYRRYSLLPGNQLAQVHRYLDEGAKLPICQAPMDELAADAVRRLRAFSADKPVLLSEVGAVEPHHAGPWKQYEKDTAGSLLHDILFAPFFAGAAAAGQSWHWDFYVEKNNLWWHFGRFREATSGFDPILENAEPVFKNLPNQLKMYGLTGKKTTLLWIRDGAATWKTELVEGKAPRRVNAQKIAPDLPKHRAVSFYDPWKNAWQPGRFNADGSLTLPEFSRSLVVKLEK